MDLETVRSLLTPGTDTLSLSLSLSLSAWLNKFPSRSNFVALYQGASTLRHAADNYREDSANQNGYHLTNYKYFHGRHKSGRIILQMARNVSLSLLARASRLIINEMPRVTTRRSLTTEHSPEGNSRLNNPASAGQSSRHLSRLNELAAESYYSKKKKRKNLDFGSSWLN